MLKNDGKKVFDVFFSSHFGASLMPLGAPFSGMEAPALKTRSRDLARRTAATGGQ
jgi:hypothetical protein